MPAVCIGTIEECINFTKVYHALSEESQRREEGKKTARKEQEKAEQRTSDKNLEGKAAQQRPKPAAAAKAAAKAAVRPEPLHRLLTGRGKTMPQRA